MNRQQKRFISARENLLVAQKSANAKIRVDALRTMYSAASDLRDYERKQVDKLICQNVSTKSAEWQDKARLIHDLNILIFTVKKALDTINSCSD